eukprot:385009-Rhodomonas_salina.1
MARAPRASKDTVTSAHRVTAKADARKHSRSALWTGDAWSCVSFPPPSPSNPPLFNPPAGSKRGKDCLCFASVQTLICNGTSIR